MEYDLPEIKATLPELEPACLKAILVLGLGSTSLLQAGLAQFQAGRTVAISGRTGSISGRQDGRDFRQGGRDFRQVGK